MSGPGGTRIQRLILDLLEPDGREASAKALADEFGAGCALLFLKDPELGIPLPAPGFPQVLPEAGAWRSAAEQASARGILDDARLIPPGAEAPGAAWGVGIPDGTALLLAGPRPHRARLEELREWLPWVSRVLSAEAALRLAKAKETLALGAVQTANRMSSALEGMRRSLEAALRKAEAEQAKARREQEERQKFVALVENSGESISMADLDGRIFYLNPFGCRLAGLARPQDAHGLAIPDLLDEDFRAPFLDIVLPAVLAQGHWEGEVRFRNLGDGQVLHVLQSLFLVRDAETRAPLCIANVVRDHTARKKAEEALKVTEAQLQQTQRMESIGQLAGGVAHDFNNLLTAINGYAELSLALASPGSPLHDNLAEIRGAGERAASLTRQLLAYSRKQMLEPRIFDLNSVVASMHNMLVRIIGEDITLSVATRPGLGPIKADPSQIEQVILNLVVNARDATPAGGTITIETRAAELDETAVAVHPEVVPGTYALLAVSDTGVGMTPEVMARIFEPFFTTKPFGKGSGMGLPMVQGIVNQSGGYIFAYSDPGLGSTFKVYLPMVADRPDQPAVAATMPGDGRGRETILLVEDEDSVRKLARGILEMQGYKVLEARDGLDGEQAAKAYGGPIDLLLTDVIMPKRNGKELAARLQALRPSMRVVFMSGYADDAIIRHGLLDREARFLQKPFTTDRLVMAVRDTLNAGNPKAAASPPVHLEPEAANRRHDRGP